MDVKKLNDLKKVVKEGEIRINKELNIFKILKTIKNLKIYTKMNKNVRLSLANHEKHVIDLGPKVVQNWNRVNRVDKK